MKVGGRNEAGAAGTWHVYARHALFVPGKDPTRALRIRDDMTVKQVWRRLDRMLRREKLSGEGISMAEWRFDTTVPFFSLVADLRWIACYAVTGNSEGHYVHVDLIGSEGQRRLVFLCKTFEGMDHAYKIAQRCAELLGA